MQYQFIYIFYSLSIFQGDVYAVDESTLFIKGFAYDGTGPDAFFWVGKTARPSPEGYIIPYPEEYVGRYVIPFLLHFSSSSLFLLHFHLKSSIHISHSIRLQPKAIYTVNSVNVE